MPNYLRPGEPSNPWQYRCDGEGCTYYRNFSEKPSHTPRCSDHGRMRLLRDPETSD